MFRDIVALIGLLKQARSSEVLLQTGRVFLMKFIVGVKSYMEVSNETSDVYASNRQLVEFHEWSESACENGYNAIFC